MTSLIPKGYEGRINVLHDILGQESLDCLTNTLSALGACVDNMVLEEPALREANFPARLLTEDNSVRCRCTHILLLGACLDLLNAGVLLLLIGYDGRALSCVRDAYEGFRFADYCLNNSDTATNWLQGKRIRKPKGHKCPDVIAIKQEADEVLNTWGTHLCYKATMYGWVSKARLTKDFGDFDKFFVWQDFGILLLASSRGLSYVLEKHPELVNKIVGVKQKLEAATSLAQKTISIVEQHYRNLVETDESASPE